MRVEDDFAAARSRPRGTVGLVPTMGFLHEGHLSLLQAARAGCETVVVSLYVNPLQFNESEDLARYPRDRDRDLSLAEDAGVDVVFAPDDATMYPSGPPVRVDVPRMATTMEGSRRPGHFEGVATAVVKLLAGLRPDLAYFGRKDAQQLAIVRRLTLDLAIPTGIVGCATVREQDGLALSSRNVLLSEEARAAALSLSVGLFAAADAAESGEQDCRVLAAAVAGAVGEAGIELEYSEVASQRDVRMLAQLEGDAFLAAAVRVNGVRLIDNVHLDTTRRGFVADRGTLLAARSILYEHHSRGTAGQMKRRPETEA